MKLLYTLAILFSCCSVHAQEIGLFNKDGKAIAYIDTKDEMSIYLYDGKPVAYIEKDNVYGFNGQHLGWYDKGSVRTHEGKIIGSTKEATNRYTQYEPYKSYKQYKPYKANQSYPPYKVYGQSDWTDDSFEELLLNGIKK
ncbi:hypothetical protein SAMN05428949_5452 [Chitinophaga sp. YR627]|uniref:4-fold beta flower protein n=1 Tax=Chitinophaga sp. YR627 TaxID=1881041 RepID=UPI0008E3B91A|nr:hypothetical protein [Chitinophaga sp. YR627]SFO50201.1 hypothetical protein SAMN05428949_5452 [Chitinophaga sp. YR627]